MTPEKFLKEFGTVAGAPGGVKRVREMVLQLAVMGKLVEQRAEDEPAGVLLERIRGEKEQFIEDGNTRRQETLPPIREDEKPYLLPVGWEWVRLGEVGETNIGLTYSPNDISSKGIPVLRSNNIQNGKLDLNDLVRVVMDIRKKALVAEGDLLICARNGSRALVGKAALFTGVVEEMAFGAFMAIYRSRINTYVLKFIQSPLFRKMIDEVNTTTINQITQGNLKHTLFPLPPLPEQHRIVAKVDELMSLCDKLESQQQERERLYPILSRTNHERFTGSPTMDNLKAIFETGGPVVAEDLRKTVLELAVRGRLVEQLPNNKVQSILDRANINWTTGSAGKIEQNFLKINCQ